MDAEQQRILSEKIKKDQMLVQLIAQESQNKRTLRSATIEMAFRTQQMTAQNNGTVTNSEMTAAIIKDAEEFFKYITQDGGIDTLERNVIQSPHL